MLNGRGLQKQNGFFLRNSQLRPEDRRQVGLWKPGCHSPRWKKAVNRDLITLVIVGIQDLKIWRFVTSSAPSLSMWASQMQPGVRHRGSAGCKTNSSHLDINVRISSTLACALNNAASRDPESPLSSLYLELLICCNLELFSCYWCNVCTINIFTPIRPMTNYLTLNPTSEAVPSESRSSRNVASWHIWRGAVEHAGMMQYFGDTEIKSVLRYLARSDHLNFGSRKVVILQYSIAIRWYVVS
jgi:hypothetical protein